MRVESFRSSLKVVYFLLLIITSCSSEEPTSSQRSSLQETDISAERAEMSVPKIHEIKYHYLITADTLAWLQSLKSGDTLDVLLFLNRVDIDHLTRQDTLVFPDTISPNFGLYSSFPNQLQVLDSVNKMILVSYYTQEFGVYENGKRVRFGPVSLGKESTQTPKGLFFTNWKSKKTHSTVDPSWILPWCFNFANYDGVSLHEYALPGYPASHACVRLFQKDAYWFYYWADQWRLSTEGQIKAYGTPILIFGEYPFQGRKPWLNLAENNNALQITEAMMVAEMKELIPMILERQKVQQRIYQEEEKEKLKKETLAVTDSN